jgi:hypothetical protein
VDPKIQNIILLIIIAAIARLGFRRSVSTVLINIPLTLKGTWQFNVFGKAFCPIIHNYKIEVVSNKGNVQQVDEHRIYCES